MTIHLRPNTLLQGGKYRIIRFIKNGGFGCTYEAEHVMLGMRVAIKEFFVQDFCERDGRTHCVTTPSQNKKKLVAKLKKKFIDEAIAICNLKHPNIVNVSDVFEENNTAYYVMDYIDGCSLQDLVESQGAMSEHRAVGYIRQVAEALKFVHFHNRLHLDIKPGNVMVDKEDHAILIDFGVSKQYDATSGENTSTLMGITPGYAPLEQMGNDVARFMPATDIYALGATLYKLLTGNTPIPASVRASGEDLAPLPQSVSQPVCEAVKNAMRLNKTIRTQSVDDFLNLLGVEDEVEVLEVVEKGTMVRKKGVHSSNEYKKVLYDILNALAVIAFLCYLIMKGVKSCGAFF